VAKEKTAEELAAEELAFKQARGDFPEQEEEEEEQEEEEVESDDDDEETGSDDDDSDESDDSDDAEDEGAESEEDGGDDRSTAGITIPKARFDEVNQKAQQKLAQKQAELDRLQAELKAKEVKGNVKELRDEITELQDTYEKHLMEGEAAEAREVRVKLDQKRDDLIELRLKEVQTTTGASTLQQVRFDTQLAALEVKHPQINPDSDEFDQDIADEVSTLLGALQSSGMTPAAALVKAVKYVVPEPEPEPEPEPDKKEVQKKTRTKRAASARRKLDTARKKSPPDTTGTGKSSDKGGSLDGLPDLSKMTIEQFDKLSPEQLVELRGDRVSDDA
jgi:hypothetical protein